MTTLVPTINISVTNRVQAVRTGEMIRRAIWSGELKRLGWLSLPTAGDMWIHCNGWASETVKWVAFYGPLQCFNDPAHRIEAEVEAEVIDHLITQHGFVEY